MYQLTSIMRLLDGLRLKLKYRLIVIMCMLCYTGLNAQSNLVKTFISGNKDTLFLKDAPIMHGSFITDVPNKYYSVNEIDGYVLVKDTLISDSILVYYRTFPEILMDPFSLRDTSIILPEDAVVLKPSIKASRISEKDIFGSGLNKTGSISRGINFGNNQNLSVNSNLNLQMSGKIAPDISILASVTDDNIPIQPQGNTQQLQDFDQVYIKVFNDKNWELVAGDFWLKKPKGYFMTYAKRAQGGTFQTSLIQDVSETPLKVHVQGSGAISKGKFARNIIDGIEGNQGPYRLVGDNDEPFIIVLSGTERVFVDGKLLIRGEQNDYVIDYNTAEVRFTPKTLITKDIRIIVEFQYSDQNYARSLFQASTVFEKGRFSGWINAYSEQDAKNQPLQLALSDVQRNVLANVGDNIDQAFASSIDTAEYSDDRILYYLIDTITTNGLYTDVLRYTINNDTGLYKASFSNVGEHQGNYVLDQITALGRVYEWVEPLLGVPQGSYEPIVLLSAPSKKQMVSAGVEWQLNKENTIGFEGAFSNYDVNTFSELDRIDNQGYALRPYVSLSKKIKTNTRITIDGKAEYLSDNYESIERFRSVEFDRNWNIRNTSLTGTQFLASGGLGIVKNKFGNAHYQFNTFLNGSTYQGLKHDLQGHLKTKGWLANADASLLTTSGSINTFFTRHNLQLQKTFGKFQIGWTDLHENNIYTGDTLGRSYQWYDWKAHVGTSDSIKNQYQIFYRQRIDKRPDSLGELGSAALANHFGGTAKLNLGRGQSLGVNIAYRTLEILDETRINQSPENTLLGRLEHKGRLLKGMLTTSTFYEVGSGLELKREFLYLEVQPGQGNFTWIDYDEDGVKDLNEFEVSAFQDQANYIRVFTPTNEYVKTFTNQFAQTLFIKPEVIWRKAKGFKSKVAKFSNQLLYRVDRKTNSSELSELYNPFITQISDTSLISVSSSFRNTLYFNRTHQKFGMDYSFQSNSSKTLLTSGFDSRQQLANELRLRWNLSQKFTLKGASEFGDEANNSDYTQGRNYDINYQTQTLEISYQPNTKLRFSLDGVYSEKQNNPSLGGELAKIINSGAELRYNQPAKGSLTGAFNWILNSYSGDDNTNLAYEMLDALKIGTNFTWSAIYQRSIGTNLQLNLNYNGRKSPENKSIHTGGVQVRALF